MVAIILSYKQHTKLISSISSSIFEFIHTWEGDFDEVITCNCNQAAPFTLIEVRIKGTVKAKKYVLDIMDITGFDLDGNDCQFNINFYELYKLLKI